MPGSSSSAIAAAQASQNASGAFPDPATVARAHHQLLADKSIQFDLPVKQYESHPTPEWMVRAFHAIREFAGWVGTGWNWILIIIVLLLLALLLVAVIPPLRGWVVGLARRGRYQDDADEPAQWAPEQTVARRLLEEADRLAAEGRFDEAVHLILFRSIEDIEAWRGDVVRPSSTSRDIARADALPDSARGVFARIVAAVERSLFGGRPLDARDWHDAREDYASFALRPA